MDVYLSRTTTMTLDPKAPWKRMSVRGADQFDLQGPLRWTDDRRELLTMRCWSELPSDLINGRLDLL